MRKIAIVNQFVTLHFIFFLRVDFSMAGNKELDNIWNKWMAKTGTAECINFIKKCCDTKDFTIVKIAFNQQH